MKWQKKQKKSKSFYSPAKINLFFHIHSKREDGYHEITSSYVAINFFDRLIFTPSEKDLFSSNCNLLWDKSNLIYQAVELFRWKTKKTLPLDIRLEKKIPMQGGLGGGSSNAATTLWALNELSNFPLSRKELIELGAEIGSDVPFFFSSGRALCTGRGEKIKEEEYEPFSAYLAIPSFGIDTSSVYNAVSIEEKKEVNDLEKAALSISTQLCTFKKRLASLGFSQLILSGSGSCYICIGTPKSFAEDIRFEKIKAISRSSQHWYEI